MPVGDGEGVGVDVTVGVSVGSAFAMAACTVASKSGVGIGSGGGWEHAVIIATMTTHQETLQANTHGYRSEQWYPAFQKTGAVDVVPSPLRRYEVVVAA